MYESVLTVMPGQAAILVNEGQMTDIFMPGRYELTTNNMPVTTTLNQWKYGFHDTFIVDIIFVNTNEIIDIPWGTSEQVTVKDEVFGLVNVGANGKYSLSITDPKLFAENLMGVKNRYTVADLKSFVTPQIAMYFKEIVTEKQMDFFDMQGYCYEAAQILKAKSDDFFGRYGIQMQKMAVQVALPETVKKSIDERASLGAFGGMDAYAYKRQVDAQADAYSKMHGIDMSELKMEDYAAPHTLAVIRDSNNVSYDPQRERIRRNTVSERREINSGTLSSAARQQRLAASNDRMLQRMSETDATENNAKEAIRQGNAERITQTAQA